MDSNFSESDESASAYGVRGKRTSTKMLELRLKTGDMFAIGYHWLQSIRYVADHHIEIIFATHEVQISGQSMKNLYRALLEHRVPFIQEEDARYGRTRPGSDPFITEIIIDRR